MKSTSQIYQAQVIGIHPPHLSMIINGRKKVSWELALKLSEMFPEKSIKWWRYAKPEQVKNFLDNNIKQDEESTHDKGE